MRGGYIDNLLMEVSYDCYTYFVSVLVSSGNSTYAWNPFCMESYLPFSIPVILYCVVWVDRSMQARKA